jgi:galactosylceramidase
LAPCSLPRSLARPTPHRAQSTDGAESSHQHDPWETPNFQRGYEWWLLAEAKKRNPNIATYGLSWAFPQWISCNPGTLTNCTGDPYSRRDQTANYIKNWVAGAKSEYGVSIDYVGSWNERAWDADYLKLLRSTLDAAGFTDTKVVAPDAGWDIAGA